MKKFIIRRMAQMLITLVGVSMLLFFALFVVNDPVATFGEKARDPVVEAQLKARYHLDDPLPVQYVK